MLGSDNRLVPESHYGVNHQDRFDTELHEIAEQVRRLGYATIDSGYSFQEIVAIAEAFERTRERYIAHWGETRLKSVDEYNTMRAPLLHGDAVFVELATNKILLQLVSLLIDGKFVLNQQNGIINPSKQQYNQGQWHRDLPYQHYVSSRPLAINALFCVDDFTKENGSTFVLPASHKAPNFPSVDYIRRNAVQVEAKKGHFIVLDCMLFHSGGFNHTPDVRRGVNHVYSIPYFKQQINLPQNLAGLNTTEEVQELLGVRFQEPQSIEQYLCSRSKTR
jgi:ectoine hydroxylase-related dioxygenase (phytanoyl-CoA dioxygenase family)